MTGYYVDIIIVIISSSIIMITNLFLFINFKSVATGDFLAIFLIIFLSSAQQKCEIL